MIVWRYRNAKLNYRTMLAERQNIDDKKQLNAYRIKNAELAEENEMLAKIIHKDNKIIPSLIIAVKRLEQSPEGAKEVLERLEDTFSEHAELIERYNAAQAQCPQTGIASLDGAFAYLLLRAQECGTEFGFGIDPAAVALSAKALGSISHLNTIVCDLCENALNAVKKVIDPRICAVFEIADGNIPRFCVYDNGEKFDERVIENLGVKRFTTRKDEGGSGIGLYTLFELLRGSKASFLIDEKPAKAGFTKCVIISFDGLSSVTILHNI